MQEFNEPKQSPDKVQPPRRPLDDAIVYAEDAVWLCENRKTLYKTRIHGALAQILKKYPQDYKLRLLFTKETKHEHPAATGE